MNPFSKPTAADGGTAGLVAFGSTKYYLKCCVGGAISCGLTETLLDTAVLYFHFGWAPTMIGYSMHGACKFGLYEVFKNTYANAMGPEMAYQNQVVLYLAASASAEFFADIAFFPMEAVKVT